MRLALAPIAAALAACATAPAAPGAAPSDLAPAPLAEERCDAGVATACRDLGRARFLGEGEPADDRLAAAYLTKACELGDPSGCAALAVPYALGRGLPQSDERALALSRRACDLGSALACSNWAVLAAEGALRPGGSAAAGAGAGDASAAHLVRQFRTACDAAVAEGCVNLGAVLEAGALVPRDLGQAARAYRRGCDAGAALACHRLAALAGDRPEAAPDANPTALESRACRAAVAPACAAAHEPVPAAGPGTPAPRLVAERTSLALGFPGAGGLDPNHLSARRGLQRVPEGARRPTAALLAAVPEPLRERLGLGREPRAGGEDEAVRILSALRRHELGQCYESPRSRPDRAAEIWVVFLLDGDGRPVDVRAAALPGDPLLEACAAETVAAWEFPEPAGAEGGPYLVRASFEAAPPGPEPAFAGPGALRPAPRDPDCLERTARLPGGGRAVGEVTVKLAVDPSGHASLVHAVTPAPDAVLAAVAEAARACAWMPGADANGRPATLWTTATVRLER